MNGLHERIKKVMAAVLSVQPVDITDETNKTSSVHWDSLHHMNLILALEQEFSVEFTDDEIRNLSSFAEICASLKLRNL